jgi:hypothetical protein
MAVVRSRRRSKGMPRRGALVGAREGRAGVVRKVSVGESLSRGVGVVMFLSKDVVVVILAVESVASYAIEAGVMRQILD